MERYTTPTAATLYEYDSFGNITKQTLALSDTPTVTNSPIVEFSYGVETTDDIQCCSDLRHYSRSRGG